MKNESITEGASSYSTMNLFSGPRGIAVKILNRIDRTDAYLDKVIEAEMKNTDLKSSDKALLYEISHGCIRWLNRLDWILTGFYKGQFVKCIPNVKNAMRVALYQIMFLDKVPPYAAVNEAVEFVKKLQGKKSADLTNAVLRNIIRNKDGIRFPDRKEDLIGYLSAYYSHPIWLIKRWLKQFGESFTEELLQANNEKPSITLRINNLISNGNEVRKLLQKEKLFYQESKYNREYLKLKSISNIADWDYFKKGCFTIQDESTGFSCKFLAPKPGMKVLDICAAPGGKTAFMADLMKNKGEIVALDLFETRINILNKNLKRLGVKNVRSVAADALEFDETGFDKILADVPCSGLGTLTKKPDIKWKRSISELNKLTEIQYSLLKKCASLLKVGGEIVYSTCTIDKVENFDIVEKFLNEHPEFSLVKANEYFDDILIDANGCVQTYPHIHGIDGAFAAKIKREK